MDPWGLQWYRTEGDDYDFGRDRAWIEPGDPISKFAEDNIAHMAKTADIHDNWNRNLTDAGIPDWLANYPTMLQAYGAACIVNNLSEYDEQHDFFTIFEIRW